MSQHIPAATDLGSRLAGAKGLLDRALRHHVLAILSGSSTAADFQALFQGLRFRSRGRRRFRDIADFIAHPDERNQGPVAELVRDVFEGARVFTMVAGGLVPSPEEARLAGHANLRLATDAAITRQCAMSRKAAAAAIDRTAAMLERGLLSAERDSFVFDTYCNRLKWYPAFHDHELYDEFLAVLRDNKLLLSGEDKELAGQSDRLSLFVLSLLHGVEVALPNGKQAGLQAGFFNPERRLEVKAHLVFDDLNKPVYAPLCVFLTSLQPEGHCDDRLLSSEAHGWDLPIVFHERGILTALA